MKKLLFLAFAAMLSVPIFAQWSIGLSGGYAYNHYDYDPQYMSGLDYKGHHGFAIDLPVNYQFNDWFGLSTGLSFQQKGFVLNGSYVPEGSEEPFVFYSDFRRDDSYYVVPMIAEFSLGNDKLEGFLDVGGYVGWWHNAMYQSKKIVSVNMESYIRNISRDFNKDVDQRLECGAIGGLGVKWNLLKPFSLYLASHAFIAFTPQQKDYQIMHFPSRNTTITTQIGFLYHFNLNTQK